jgi:hypothetical protein
VTEDELVEYFRTKADAWLSRYRKRRARQLKTAKKRIKRNKTLKMPAAKKKAIILRYLQRKRGKSTATAKHFNQIGKQKAFWRKKRMSRPAKMDGRKSPPRGRALDIPDLGYVNKSRINPRLWYWAIQERERDGLRKQEAMRAAAQEQANSGAD